MDKTSRVVKILQGEGHENPSLLEGKNWKGKKLPSWFRRGGAMRAGVVGQEIRVPSTVGPR